MAGLTNTTYALSAWLWSFTNGNMWSEDGQLTARIGLSTTGLCVGCRTPACIPVLSESSPRVVSMTFASLVAPCLSLPRIFHSRAGSSCAGATDPSSATIVWTPLLFSQSTYAQVYLTASPVAGALTVFLQGASSEAATAVFAFDNVLLTTL